MLELTASHGRRRRNWAPHSIPSGRTASCRGVLVTLLLLCLNAKARINFKKGKVHLGLRFQRKSPDRGGGMAGGWSKRLRDQHFDSKLKVGRVN